MTGAMRHRGPDGDGTIDLPEASLGMTRLAIQDVSAAADQPMANDGRTVWIVYNGELYNAPSERRHLESLGHRFRSTGDTEVVLKLYEQYGDAFLERLRGIFALCIADLRGGPDRARFLLARDQIGVKPLLLAETGGGLVFASEMKAMLDSGLVERRVDPAAVRSLLLRGSVYQPRSIVRGVSMLPPGHFVVIEGGRTRQQRYWSLGLDRAGGLRSKPYDGQVEAFRDLLDQTVARQLISDVPVGAFLSGGVDSATLVALMTKHAEGRVRTFSVGFEGRGSIGDETGNARRFATFLGTEHTTVTVAAEEVRDRFDDIVLALDQPTVDGVNTWVVARAAAAAVKVAVSGTGGDDLFMGYPWHASMLRTQPEGAQFLSRYASLSARFHMTFTDDDIARMLAPGLRSAMNEPAEAAVVPTDELPDAGPVDRMTALTLRGYTLNQLLRDIDAVSMAHALEVRVPFLDVAVIEAALSLPVESRIARPVPDNPLVNSYADSGIKRILVDAARPLLPAGFDHEPKRGFSVPVHRWLRGPLKDMAQSMLDERRVTASGVLDAGLMPKAREFAASGRMNGWRVWMIMVLQRWLELNRVTA